MMDYDNGAANAPVSGNRNEKSKRSKHTKKSLAKELATEKARTNELMERLLKLEEENKSLRNIRQNNQQTDDEVYASSVEFNKEPGASSTQRAELLPSGIGHTSSVAVPEETRFASSINQLALSTIAIPECKSLTEGEEIDRQTFDLWLEMLNNCMHLAGIADETTQFTVMKVKAGPRLLQIYKNTRSDESAPDYSLQPFSNAVHRLKAYFGSMSDVMLQRRKLSAMVQKSEESDLAFVNRVATTARLCDFEGSKEFEEIIRAVAEHATYKQVRVAALKIQNRGGTYTQLIDKVREIQSIRLNEEIFAASHRNTESAVIAPVRAGSSTEPRRHFEQTRQRVDNHQLRNNRSRPYFVGHKQNEERFNPRDHFQQFVRPRQTNFGSARRLQPNGGQRWKTNNNLSRPQPDSNFSREDWRCRNCNSPFHDAVKCPNTNLNCWNCDKVGHIQRACPFPLRSNYGSRQSPRAPEAKPNLVAIVDAETEIVKSDDQISNGPENMFGSMDPLVLATIGILADDGMVSAKVAGLSCNFLVDSGAQGKNDIRLVIDLRGPNRYIHRTPFSMPTMESILSDLKGANLFSTIDLSNAYFHVELDESSRHLTNFFTEFGMFRYVRLPFGLCNAPDLFQEILQRQILGGCEGFRNYLDDLIIYGSTKEEHDTRLSAILARLQQHNVKLNNSKVAGDENIADTLSRLIEGSQTAIPFDEDDEAHLLYSLDAGIMQLTWEDIEKASESDAEMHRIHQALRTNNWPKDLRKFEAQKKALYALGFLLFKGDRAVLPQVLRSKALAYAHGGHVGETAMKRIMREYFWWPGMSLDTIRFVKDCETCAVLSKRNRPLPLSPREMPEGPWEIVQIDFLAIPGCGSGEFLIAVDTHSRYLSVIEMKHTDAASTNAALCEIFKLWGCPLILQSDNGPPFQGSSFIDFWEARGVRVRKSIPLNPQTNGLVERQNQGLIKALAASKIDGTNWRQALQEYVHKHNTLVPHSRLGVTPFELMVGWKFRGTFPSLWSHDDGAVIDIEEIRERDAEAKLRDKKYADSARGAAESNIRAGDTVLMAQPRKSKLDPTFSKERFKVLARNGAKVVIASQGGIQYCRKVDDVKRASITDPEIIDASMEHLDDTESGFTGLQEHQDINAAKDKLVTRRQQGCEIKRPSRFDDNFVYCVYN
ncbi:uncharacterized protein K02A2.6-like [Uranotaenia lowii]|uniref:uncharacterized protein K02A2.6-like n=1 Tax=Uranotaenia lowii TaxID=190385 RepID=UPI002479431C|nr:uncharacterized protein K02A2.6-like [Uranotaenia lowii]